MDDLTTERGFYSQVSWLLMYFACFSRILHVYLYNWTLADVRTTVAGILYLHCSHSNHYSILLTSNYLHLKLSLVGIFKQKCLVKVIGTRVMISTLK